MFTANLRKKVSRQLISRLTEQEKGLRKNTIRICLYLAALYLVYLFCAGDFGLFRIYRLHRQQWRLEQEYYDIVTEAVDYSGRLERIKNDPHYIEWIARTRYGYSRPEETIYHLKSTSN